MSCSSRGWVYGLAVVLAGTTTPIRLGGGLGRPVEKYWQCLPGGDTAMLVSLRSDPALLSTLDGAEAFRGRATIAACFEKPAPLSEVAGWIETQASKWNANGAVKIEFPKTPQGYEVCGSPRREIRIDTSRGGYKSLIGREENSTAGASMSLAGIDETLKKTVREDGTFGATLDLQTIVIHEFGHALGLLHEEQNTESQCWKWIDWNNAYRILTGPPDNWTPQEVRANLGPPANVGKVVTSGPFDGKSVMCQDLSNQIWIGDRPPRECARVALQAGSEAQPSAQDLQNVRDFYSEDSVMLAKRLTRLKQSGQAQGLSKGLAAWLRRAAILVAGDLEMRSRLTSPATERGSPGVRGPERQSLR